MVVWYGCRRIRTCREWLRGSVIFVLSGLQSGGLEVQERSYDFLARYWQRILFIIVDVTTERGRFHFLERFLTEIDFFPLLWQYVLKQETVILESSSDINNIISILESHLHPPIILKSIFHFWFFKKFCPLLVHFLTDRRYSRIPPRTQEAPLTRMRVRMSNFSFKIYIRVYSHSSLKYLELLTIIFKLSS